MNDNILKVLNNITAQYGAEVLGDPRRLNAFFSDLAKDEPKPLRIAFGRCIEGGAYTALKTAPDAAERALRKAAIARSVRDEHGLDAALCAEALDILEAALFGNEQPPLLCASCGKAVEEGWKECPHCGAALAREAPPVQPPIQTAPAASHAVPVPARNKRSLRNALIIAGLALALGSAVITGVVAYQQHQQRLAAEEVARAEAARAAAARAEVARAEARAEAARAEAERAAAARVEAARAEAARQEVVRSAANMVRIPGGTFTMGSPANEPERDNDEVRHQVTVSAFSIGKYEVTQLEWREVMGNNPSNRKGDNLPVEQVSWYEAVEYCNKRSRRERLTPSYTINGTNVSWNRSANGYRLPTEAEWEYACRAGTTTPFNTGKNITKNQANYDGNYPYKVGSFTPNGWGLYDMHGNVWEWCWDWYGNYSSGSQGDPAGPSTGTDRVLRGGSWIDGAQYLRSAYRYIDTPSFLGDDVGFRVVRSR